MSDLISRQAAIDALTRKMVSIPTAGEKDLMGDVNRIRAEDISVIRRLPSAQPEPCKDVVKREDVQSIAEKSDWFESSDSFNDFMWALYELPSAQSERQKGEWIDYTEDGYVECPFCHSATNCDGNKDELHFCFSCGADMRGEQDG